MSVHRQRPERSRIAAWAIPSVVVIASFAIIAVAAIAFFVTGRTDKQADVVAAAPTATPATPEASKPPPSPKPKKTKATKKPQELPRAFVEVYNNSGISGLADKTSGQVQGDGWKVVAVDNWYGNIPETTVYYPDSMKRQAQLLADDLGVDRIRPAVDPMSFDRLTLILTGQI